MIDLKLLKRKVSIVSAVLGIVFIFILGVIKFFQIIF
jgi:hypothetical protein